MTTACSPNCSGNDPMPGADPELFRQLGADVVAIGVTPDGVNINHDAGATHPQLLQSTVRAHHAHIGVANNIHWVIW